MNISIGDTIRVIYKSFDNIGDLKTFNGFIIGTYTGMILKKSQERIYFHNKKQKRTKAFYINQIKILSTHSSIPNSYTLSLFRLYYTIFV